MKVSIRIAGEDNNKTQLKTVIGDLGITKLGSPVKGGKSGGAIPVPELLRG